MRKFFVLILSLILAVAMLTSCGAEAGEVISFIPETEDNARSIADLCASKKNITVGFTGGSITDGGTYTKPYMEYLRETYPDNVFTEINSSAGGTGSLFGVHRLEDYLLDYEPDIVFVEFSVNDADSDTDLITRTMEGIIRKILKKDAGTLVVLLGTASSACNYETGVYPESIDAHKRVADYYNIPYINVGKELLLHIADSGEDWYYYFQDGVHPNNNGGAYYAEVMKQFLADYKFDIDFKSEPLTVNDFENADSFWARDYINDSWSFVPGGMHRTMGGSPILGCISANEIGASLEFDFYGTALGFYGLKEPDSGILEYSVDGGEWQEVSMYSDFYIVNDGHYHHVFENLADNLENTKHHVVMRVSDRKEDVSKGNSIKISFFIFSAE